MRASFMGNLKKRNELRKFPAFFPITAFSDLTYSTVKKDAIVVILLVDGVNMSCSRLELIFSCLKIYRGSKLFANGPAVVQTS